MNFYVYSILDPRKPGVYKYEELEFAYEPIYIGKGKKNRLNEHLKTRALRKNSFKTNKIKNILKEGFKPIIIKLRENLEEQEALKLEKEYISRIGRYPNGTLTNLTDGGEGVSGLKHTQESKEKMFKTWFKLGQQPWNFGKTMSKEHCEKLSRSHLGQVISESTRLAISNAHKGKRQSSDWVEKKRNSLCKKKYLVTYPDGTIKTVSNYNEFCKNNNLSAGSMSLVLNGKRDHYKNYKICCIA